MTGYDMPPKWDGLDVTWAAWTEVGHPTHYAQPCQHCGSTRPPLASRGTITAPTRHLPQFRSPNPALRRLQGAQIDAAPLKQLTATRCPACLFTEVYDPMADEAWELEPDDYRDDGSWPTPPLTATHCPNCTCKEDDQ